MPQPSFIIVRVVRGCHFDGSGTELHVDGDGIGDDGETAVGDEGMNGEFTVEVL